MLTECGLVIVRQQGRERYCEAQLGQLGQVASWIEPYRKEWEHPFSALDHLLDQLQSKTMPKPKPKTKKRKGP